MARVYVSCAEQDRDLSARIKDWLRFQDYEPVSLQDETDGGAANMAQWHRQFAQTLEHCDLVILVLTPEWADSKWCFAEFTEAYSIGKTILAVIEKPLDEPFSEPGISVFDLTQERDVGLSELASALRGALPSTGSGVDFDPDRPVYPGLRAYEEKDGPIFFCRDDDIRRAIDRLNTRRRQGGARLMALLGAPGTGISSLLMAGILPRLQKDQDGWIVLPVMRPSLRPIDELSKSIARLLGNFELWREWAELFRGNDFKGVARELAEQLRERFGKSSAHILLPIDQAEELFSIADPADAEQFLDVLGAIFDDDMPYVGVAALRPDFLEDFQTADQLSHVIEEFSPRLMPLSTIREIITRPGGLIQMPIEDSLVEQLLNDALKEGALPLVSIVLHQLYLHTNQQDGLTLDAYSMIGTDYAGETALGNIIARLAEEIFDEEQPSEGQLLTLEDVFSRKLLWRDNDNRYVSRPVALDDINLKTRVVIRKFIEAGLLITRDIDGYEMVEYAHLSILDHWPRLTNWITQSGDGEETAQSGALQIAPPAPTGGEGFGQEPEELSASSYRLEENSFSEAGFIDEAHNYVQAEILGPETLDPRYDPAEEERLSVPPSIFSEHEEKYATPEVAEVRKDTPAFIDNLTEQEAFAEDQFSKTEYIEERETEVEPAYSGKYIAPRNDGFDYNEKPKKKSGRFKIIAVGAIAAAAAIVGLVYWPIVQEQLLNPGASDQVADATSKKTPKGISQDSWKNVEVRLGNDATPTKQPEDNKQTAKLNQTPPPAKKDIQKVAKAPDLGAETKLDKKWPLLKLALSFEELNDRKASKEVRINAQGTLVASLQKMKTSFKLKGHKGKVSHVAFDPKGVFVATGSADGAIRIWDLLTGSTVKVLYGHGAAVNSVAFSPDGAMLVSASEDNTARIWDVSKGILIKTLNSHRRGVTYAEFNSVGDRVATASKDRSAHIWDVKQGKILFRLIGHEAAINSIAFSKNGNWIATASEDFTGRIWDASSGQHMVSLRGHSKAVKSIRFSGEGDKVMTASADKTINLWHTFSGKKAQSLIGHLNGVESANFSPDGNLVLSTSTTGKTLLWDVENGALLTAIRGRRGGLFKAVFSSNGDWIASASKGKIAHILPSQLFINSKVFEGHTDRVFSAVLDKSGEYLLTASRDNTARVWNITSGAQEVLLVGHIGQVHHSVFSPDQNSIATASKDKTIRIWDRESGRTLRIFKSEDGAVNRVAFSPNGKQIAAAYQNNKVKIWDIASSKVAHILNGHEGPVWSVVYSNDGQKLFSSSTDKSIRVWNVKTGKLEKALEGHNKSVLAMALSPDGKTLASGSVDGTVRFWNAKSFEQNKNILKHNTIITSLGFSSDGKSILTGSFDKIARLWNIEQSKVVWKYASHGDRVLSASLNEEGNWALTSSSDNAYLWRVFSAPELSFYVKSILPRCLTQIEREKLGLSKSEPSWCKDMEEWRAVRGQ